MKNNRGVLAAVGAYVLWGILPLYWKALRSVPAIQILSHRVIWSCLFLLGLLLLRGEWARFRTALRSWRTLAIYSLAAVLLGANWLTYIWGVNAGRVVETSLGYFINPLVNVFLGMVFLQEKLRPVQWAPWGLAAAGVIYLTWAYGALPWIALVLALTFGLYGLLKKVAPLEALPGLALETAVLTLPCLGLLTWAEVNGQGALGHSGALVNLLLVLTGVVTATPLLLFGLAARRTPLSTLGIIQYLSPTCQFILGVFVFKEAFDASRLVGFSLIWVALIIFWVEGALAQHKKGIVKGV
jgi:chloramphenicol-sensitive protein RarD